MSHHRRAFAVFLFVAALLSGDAGSATEEQAYSDLVGCLTDMKRLAMPPEVGVTSGNFSSWDRRAQYDETTGKCVDWWANDDWRGFIDCEGTTIKIGGMDREGTMMKMDGPGVIWRIWSAKPESGNLEFYIDGDQKPTVALPFIDLFTKEPYSKYAELVHIKAMGRNFFIPIPFQKSIRIRGGEGWGRYYQITYTKFPDGTNVPSFTGKFSDEDRKALEKANAIWEKRGPELFVTDEADAAVRTVTVKPGEEVAIAEYAEPGAIVSITMDRPKMDRKASIDILRELAISIRWDGEEQPSVWAPLGDFFGTGAGENLYRTMVTGMTDAKYYANWYMPFVSAKVTVRNDGDKQRDLTFTIHTEKVVGAEDLLRYHCKWQRDDFSGLEENRFMADRWPDWPIVKIDGAAGRFCGFHMHVWNPLHIKDRRLKDKYILPFPKSDFFAPGTRAHIFYNQHVRVHYWWGEGDEKFFVDGEKMPSTFGTGTEDYFGYAWGNPQAFDSGLQAQPLNGASDEIGKVVHRDGNRGHICNLRWQVADNVPFQKSFEATIEKYHPNNWPLLIAITASWYQEPGKPDYYKAKPIKQRKDYYIEPEPLPPGE